MRVTADSYRLAAMANVTAARELLDGKFYVQAHYLSGVAVECMLRAYALRLNRVLGANEEFNARHDLRRLYKEAGYDDIVPVPDREEVGIAISDVVSQWNNSQRYWSEELLRAHLRSNGNSRGIKGDFIKALTGRVVNGALTIVSLGEAQWERSGKKLKRS